MKKLFDKFLSKGLGNREYHYRNRYCQLFSDIDYLLVSRHTYVASKLTKNPISAVYAVPFILIYEVFLLVLPSKFHLKIHS
jgi:hypothetical protein